MPSIARHSYGITLHASSYKPLLNVLNMDEHTFKRSVAVDGLLGGTGAIDPMAMVSPANIDSTSFRAHRQKLEKLLSEGLNIQWGHSLERAAETSSGVDLHFQNGRKLEGSRFVGTDGPHSIARKSLSPDTSLTVLPYVAFNGRRRIDRALFESTYYPVMGRSNVMKLRQADVVLNISVNDQQADIVDLGWIYSRPARGPHDLLHNPSRPLSGAREVPKELFAEIKALSNLQQPFKDMFDAEKMEGMRILHWLMRTVLVEPQVLYRLAKKGAFFIGDSVHAEPILGGQGANNAITDGIELAKCLSTSGADGIRSWYESRYPAWESSVRSSEGAIAEMHRAIAAHEDF
jgi:2-polyprenyl-6-methoxyphenol hydroxylase-like FAD-dependent oxidoreductase